MRIAVLRLLVAAAVVAGLVSGCTGASSPQPAHTPQPTRAVQSLAGLRDVRPCPGIAGFNCGSLSVRLDPSGSVPGRLSLRVVVPTAGHSVQNRAAGDPAEAELARFLG